MEAHCDIVCMTVCTWVGLEVGLWKISWRMGVRHDLPIVATIELESESTVSFLGFVSFMVCNLIICTIRSFGFLESVDEDDDGTIANAALTWVMASRRELAHTNWDGIVCLVLGSALAACCNMSGKESVGD